MDLKEQIIDVVGVERCSDDPRDLAACVKDHSLVRGSLPAFVVSADNTEEVQKIVKLANESGTPVVPRSSNIHFHGNSLPKLGGIVLNLSGMNKILDVDEKNRKVRIETGVTWSQIEEVLTPKRMRIMMPLMAHPERSVLSSCFEREVPVTPIYEYSELIGGAEVVWPNGDIFRTGSASVPGYPKSASKGANFEGPGLNFIQLLKGAQGTMGVVTWANVKIEFRPHMDKTFFGLFDDLNSAVNPVYRIERLRIGHECFLINNVDFALILAEDSVEEYERLKKVLPPWVLVLVLSGLQRRPEEKIAYEERALLKLKNEEFPEMSISTALPSVPGAGTRMKAKLRKTQPGTSRYWKHLHKGGCEDLLFISKLSDAPRFLNSIRESAVKNGYPLSELGCYVQPIEYGRACHLEVNFFYEPDNLTEIEVIRKTKLEAARVLLDQGAFFSRPYGDVTSIVYERAGIYMAALKKIKEIFDPNNIMNPGNLCF